MNIWDRLYRNWRGNGACPKRLFARRGDVLLFGYNWVRNELSALSDRLQRFCDFFGGQANETPCSLNTRALAATLSNRGQQVAQIVDGQRADLSQPTVSPALYRWPSFTPGNPRPADVALNNHHYPAA